MIKISTKIEMPTPSNRYEAPDVFQKVTEYINICEAGEASAYHFKYLKNLYSKLNNKPNLPCKLRSLMQQLTEFMTKHAGQDSGEGQLDLDGVDIFKYED